MSAIYKKCLLASAFVAIMGMTGSWALQSGEKAGAVPQSGPPAVEGDTRPLIIEPPTSSISLDCGERALEVAKERHSMDSLPQEQQSKADRAANHLRSAQIHLQHRQIGLGRKDLEAAIPLLSELVQVRPEHWEFYDALNYASQQRWELTLPPGQRQTINTAKSDLDKKNWRDVIGLLGSLTETGTKLSEQPESWVLYDALAYAELKEADAAAGVQQYARALNTYEKAIELMQKGHSAGVEETCGASHMWSNKGYIYLRLNRKQDAVTAYETAARKAHFDPQPTVAHLNLCIAYYDAGQWQEAIEACNQATTDNPNNANAWLVKGKSLVKDRWPGALCAEGRERAKEAFRRYVSLAAPTGLHVSEGKDWLQYLRNDDPRCGPEDKTRSAEATPSSK